MMHSDTEQSNSEAFERERGSEVSRPAMASLLDSVVLVYPASTDRSRGRRRTSNSCLSVSRDRTANYATLKNARHFSSSRSATATSSPLSYWVSKVGRHCSRASLTDSSSPIDSRGESLGCGGILVKSDHASAAKTKECLVAAIQDTLNRFQHGQLASTGLDHSGRSESFQHGHLNSKGDNLHHRGDALHQRQITPTWANHSAWKVFLRSAACVVVASVILCTCLPRAAHALAENSIGASSLGLRVADFLRRSGLPDELVVVIVSMLPVLELRGAIPVGYWLKMDPVKGYILSVVGNMIPVPFIVLYLEKILQTIGESSGTGLKFVRWVVNRTRKKAGPIEEFEWLGLCLFVAVPLPGTGAWTGAIAASILGMPFWDAVTANFFGVVLAGLLVTLLVRVGTKEAVLVCIAMIICSCFVWSVLRLFQPKRGTSST